MEPSPHVAGVRLRLVRMICPKTNALTLFKGASMSDKIPQKDSAKKVGKSMKEKRAAKKAKKESKTLNQ